MRRLTATLAILLLVASFASAASEPEYDDCDANFIAAIGSSAYQFSPRHDGELGSVRLFSILSYNRAAHAGRFGRALWKVEIRPEGSDAPVLTANGASRIGREGATIAELWWDGRDDRGELVPPGRYRYTFRARYLSDHRARLRPARQYDELGELEQGAADEALASEDVVVVNYELTEKTARQIRVSATNTNCQIQQNVPLESGFPYNFYYGSTHAHSNWSDGGQPTTACSSGNAYGSGNFTPTDVYGYARNTAGMNFWVINEHNHLINDAVATNAGPVTEAKVRQRYADGIAAANAASVNGAFVGIYGMEWGVTSNPDQGHITLLETPKLLGWETCTTCNGPSPECTPGTDCYFDVFTPKRYGYLTLYQRSVENPSAAGALGIFNHPSSGNFDNFAFNANADNAMQGIAVRSGLAFSTATDCANANVGATDYSGRWLEALNKGFHLAPTADHDSHCNNYGVAIPTRTVYLAPALTKADLLAAHRARRFYASEDSNLQLVFRTGDGSRVMGEIFNAANGATLVGNVYDPDNETVSTIELWRGTIGGGVPAAPYQTWSGTSQVSFTESLTSGTYWYFIRVVQADGHDAWSAPMWITYSASSDTTAPTTSITAPAAGATVSGTTLVTASASDNVGVSKVEFFLDGALQSSDTTAPYEWSWNTTTATNASHTLTSKAYDAANNVGTSAAVSVTVSNAGGGDTTAPATSISAPAAGATVSGTTLVTATATDDVGVSKVEFYLDGVLQSTDTASPYEWSWNTTAVSNGAHTLSSRAYDAANNVGTSANVSVTVSNSTTGTDLSGWKVTQANAAYEYILPAGTTIPADGYVVIARSADKAAFETFWKITLPANVTYINSAGAMPVINGDETYTLVNAAGSVVDAPAAAMTATAGKTIQRVDPCGTTWNTLADTSGNPGSGAGAGCGGGVKINEFSDASGTGNYVYEFVELHNDSAGAADTTAPTTSISSPAAGATVSGTTLVTASASDDVGVSKVEFYLDGTLQATDTASPYEWSWNTTTAANGSHSLTSKAYDAANNVGTSTAVSVTVSNDTTAPTTSITAPAGGATVSGTTLVTATASDNVGVTKVEFFLDGALQATDTASPYEWSWNTTTAANGAHSLTSKAYDAANNVGTSAAVSVTVSNGTPIDLSNYSVVQTNAALTFVIPAGVTIPSNGYVVIGRNATKAQFETFWGRTLGANVVYINAADAMPQINGSETYTLKNAAGTKLDGATVAMATAGGESLQRTNGCGNSTKAASWSRVAASSATPGSGAPAPCGKGVYISEFSDALGTGNFAYEFVELYNDK